MRGVWALVLAAGFGTRFRDGPGNASRKIAAAVAGRSLAAWSVDAAQRACDGVTLVTAPLMTDDEVAALVPQGVDRVASGGVTRSASVRAGLVTVPEGIDVVVCHDAARPGASAELFAAVIAAVRGGVDGAVPVLPVADTLKRIHTDDAADRSIVTRTVDRTGLFAVQTPQAFRRSLLERAHADEQDATDDAALVESVGGAVVAVPGEPTAHKVTTPADLVVVEALLRHVGCIGSRT